MDTQGFGADNVPAIETELQYPYQLAVDESGNIFIGHNSSLINRRIRKVDTNGIITTVLKPYKVGGLVVDQANNLLFADSMFSRIRKIDSSTGIITTVVGNGSSGYSGDGGPATEASLDNPVDITFNGSVNFASDYASAAAVFNSSS